MATMTAVAWIGVMFLAAVVIRAKVKPIGNMLVPACLIGGIIGCILMNTVGLPGTTAAEYSTISGQMYPFMFINLGLTLPIPNDAAMFVKIDHGCLLLLGKPCSHKTS